MNEQSPREEEAGQGVRVTIFGEEYVLRSEMGEEYTRRCARYVDEAIQEAHVKAHVSEAHKAAILAALEITDELFRARSEKESLERGVTERLASLRSQVERAVE